MKKTFYLTFSLVVLVFLFASLTQTTIVSAFPASSEPSASDPKSTSVSSPSEIEPVEPASVSSEPTLPAPTPKNTAPTSRLTLVSIISFGGLAYLFIWLGGWYERKMRKK